MNFRLLLWLFFCSVFASTLTLHTTYATTTEPFIATTTITVSICGDLVVNAGEECDVPGETGDYSTSIAGRQCSEQCLFGPYCGDGILQTIYDEECDDGNNTAGDFCSATCTIEPAGSGGGGSSGGSRGGGGGSNEDLGDTQINVSGFAYPNRTVTILLDAESVGTVRADNDGEFDFAIEASPGAASMGFWSTDLYNTRSITFNTTFDVTQGAITNVRGIMLPPTIRADDTEINPGDIVTVSGQTAPGSVVQIFVDNVQKAEALSGTNGAWQHAYNTLGLSAAEHTIKARYLRGSGSLRTESSFSTSLTLFVGVDGRAVTPSDLNRDTGVNLVDFSILIFWWQTSGGSASPSPDINGNGNVGIEDFSILLFNWTG